VSVPGAGERPGRRACVPSAAPASRAPRLRPGCRLPPGTPRRPGCAGRPDRDDGRLGVAFPVRVAGTGIWRPGCHFLPGCPGAGPGSGRPRP